VFPAVRRQHFDTIEIEKLQVGRKQGPTEIGRLVEIDADLLLHSRLIANGPDLS